MKKLISIFIAAIFFCGGLGAQPAFAPANQRVAA